MTAKYDKTCLDNCKERHRVSNTDGKGCSRNDRNSKGLKKIAMDQEVPMVWRAHCSVPDPCFPLCSHLQAISPFQLCQETSQAKP